MLKKINSAHGEIAVQENNQQRWLTINNEIEGRVYLDQDSKQALPIPASHYAYMGILPCLEYVYNKNHDSPFHACIFGLGAGMMASLLLSLFPSLKLTVVEYDAQIIGLARQYFYGIKSFEQQNRLKIINTNATDFLDKQLDLNNYKFFICDIYNGNELSGDCFNLFMQLAKDYSAWANIIIHHNSFEYQHLLKNIEQDHGLNLLSFPVTKITNQQDGYNWVLTNHTKFMSSLDVFNLFRDFKTSSINHSIVNKANKIYQELLHQIPMKAILE